MSEYWNSLLAQISQFPPALQILAISMATFVTEEVAALAALGLSRNGTTSWWITVPAIYLGTMLANTLPWVIGRLVGRRMLEWKMFRSLHKSGKIDSVRHHVVRQGWIAICVARFIPGSRIPLYVAAGIMGMRSSTFLIALSLSTIVWILALLGLIQTLMKVLEGNPIDLIVVFGAGSLAIWIFSKWKKKQKHKSQQDVLAP